MRIIIIHVLQCGITRQFFSLSNYMLYEVSKGCNNFFFFYRSNLNWCQVIHTLECYTKTAQATSKHVLSWSAPNHPPRVSWIHVHSLRSGSLPNCMRSEVSKLCYSLSIISLLELKPIFSPFLFGRLLTSLTTLYVLLEAASTNHQLRVAWRHVPGLHNAITR